MNSADTTSSTRPGGAARSCQALTLITPKERARLERIADLEMRSLSATLRMMMIRGMDAYDAETRAAEAAAGGRSR